MSWKIGTGLAALLGLLMLSTAASAQECKDDSACPKGYSCEVTGESGGCGNAVTPAPNCKPGTDCPVIDASAPPDCTTQDYKSCVPGPCKADSDCAEGMICFATTDTVNRCIPRYLAPCKQAADCGEGFDCVLDQAPCACAGSAGGATPGDPGAGSGSGSGGQAKDLPLPAPDAGAADQPAGAAGATDCDCKPATTMACQPKQIDCDDATQCPKNWSCEQTKAHDSVCTAPAKPDTDAGTVDCVHHANPVSTNGQCQPPFADLGFGIAEDGVARSSAAGGDKSSTEGSAAPTAAHTADDTASNTKKSSTCSVARVAGGVDRTGQVVLTLGVLGMFVTVRRARRRSAGTAR